MRQTRNLEYGLPYRGFKSLPLRHVLYKNQSLALIFGFLPTILPTMRRRIAADNAG